jgi:ribosome-binding protein aMBF1 (putative translation factor)
MEQDWTPIVVRKKKTVIEKIISGEIQPVKKFNTKSNTQTANDIDAKKLEEDLITLPVITRTLATAIRDARIAKKLTQDQLNRECGFPINTISNYEKCIGIPKSQYINTMGKKLGVQLKNK